MDSGHHDIGPGEWISVPLRADEHVRIEALCGGQALEIIAYMQNDPRERLSTLLTSLVEFASRPRTSMRLWSQNYSPLLRVSEQTHDRHDLQLEACTPFLTSGVLEPVVTGSCWENFRDALATVDLPEKWIPYPLGIFRSCGIVDGRFQLLPATSSGGDFMDLVAESDISVVVSACPVSAPRTTEGVRTARIAWSGVYAHHG